MLTSIAKTSKIHVVKCRYSGKNRVQYILYTHEVSEPGQNWIEKIENQRPS